MSAPMEAGRFGSGHTVRRIEDPALVAGQGRFTDDLLRPNLAHVVFLRSPYAHARIVSIDTSAAREMPGVIAVITGADLVQAGVKPMAAEIPFPRPDGKPAATAPRRALAHETVRYVGEAVAAVIAESRALATNAAEAVMVEYDELPAVVDAIRATAPGAPVLWPAALTTSPPKRDMATRKQPQRRSHAPPTWCRSRSTISGSRRARWSPESCSPKSKRAAAACSCTPATRCRPRCANRS